jgi:hypothetical protein
MRSAPLRAYDEAGLRHVVPPVTSATVSPEAAAYEMDAVAAIAPALRRGQ